MKTYRVKFQYTVYDSMYINAEDADAAEAACELLESRLHHNVVAVETEEVPFEENP